MLVPQGGVEQGGSRNRGSLMVVSQGGSSKVFPQRGWILSVVPYEWFPKGDPKWGSLKFGTQMRVPQEGSRKGIPTEGVPQEAYHEVGPASVAPKGILQGRSLKAGPPKGFPHGGSPRGLQRCPPWVGPQGRSTRVSIMGGRQRRVTKMGPPSGVKQRGPPKGLAQRGSPKGVQKVGYPNGSTQVLSPVVVPQGGSRKVGSHQGRPQREVLHGGYLKESPESGVLKGGSHNGDPPQGGSQRVVHQGWFPKGGPPRRSFKGCPQL
jgi:hypothetical protein